mmetsp:Transcript_39478/g.112723  ORF Transcript_39478/g.112723 Transcript_39478/m.112723 type:complete len:244 (+) Transcript_39478:955-1686(+)
MSALRGVGRPAAFRQARVVCLLRAESTAEARCPGRPRASHSRATSGTESSTKVQMPSTLPVRPSSPRAWMISRACWKIASELCDMSNGKNFAMMPSSTMLALQESGCSMTTDLMPSSAARWKVNFLPGRPAEMKTMVEPLASCLRRPCVSRVWPWSRSGGSFASIWNVAVGMIERMMFSRSWLVMGLGRLPGEATSCSTSNLDRALFCFRPSPSRLEGMSESICTAGRATSASSMTMSKSTSR